MRLPIYIPSKGRPDSRLLTELLEMNANYKVVVEPQDYEDYHKAGHTGKIIMLPENDQGIAYARNFIIISAEAYGNDWFWMLDDDLKFYTVAGGKCIPARCIDVLKHAEQYFLGAENVGQVALEYRQFAWSATREITRNSYCDCAVAINTKVTKSKPDKPPFARYDQKITLKEDRDFTIQVLKAGFETWRINTVAFGGPAIGSNAGGLQEKYEGGSAEAMDSLYMEKKWGPDICQAYFKKDGRPEVKIHWKNIQKQQASLF